MFILDFPTLTSKQIKSPIADKMILTNMFVLRNMIYFMTLDFSKKAEVYLLDLNRNFVWHQEIPQFPINFSVPSEQIDTGLFSLPFYQ